MHSDQMCGRTKNIEGLDDDRIMVSKSVLSRHQYYTCTVHFTFNIFKGEIEIKTLIIHKYYT